MTFARRKTPYNVAELYDYAVGALARRARSVAELKRLMRPRVGNQEGGETMIQVVIDKLKEQHYLNDTAFATSYSGFRREEKLGRMRVINDLKKKGVHADVIEKSVAEAYQGVNEEKLAREYLQHKRLKKPEDNKQAAKIFRALVRAGFGTRTIFAILKNWDVDEEVITALEGEAEE
jgi:regulatory protein